MCVFVCCFVAFTEDICQLKNMQAQLSLFVCSVAKSHFHVVWSEIGRCHFIRIYICFDRILFCAFSLFLVRRLCFALANRSRNSYHRCEWHWARACVFVSHCIKVCIFWYNKDKTQKTDPGHYSSRSILDIKLNGICSERKPEKRHTTRPKQQQQQQTDQDAKQNRTKCKENYK